MCTFSLIEIDDSSTERKVTLLLGDTVNALAILRRFAIFGHEHKRREGL